MAKLKINIKSLATEARDNRKEARQFKGLQKWSLNHHRQTVIRPESRVAQWLYAYCRGVPRCVIERHHRPDDGGTAQLARRAQQKATRLGIDLSGFSEWLES